MDFKRFNEQALIQGGKIVSFFAKDITVGHITAERLPDQRRRFVAVTFADRWRIHGKLPALYFKESQMTGLDDMAVVNMKLRSQVVLLIFEKWFHRVFFRVSPGSRRGLYKTEDAAVKLCAAPAVENQRDK